MPESSPDRLWVRGEAYVVTLRKIEPVLYNVSVSSVISDPKETVPLFGSGAEHAKDCQEPVRFSWDDDTVQRNCHLIK